MSGFLDKLSDQFDKLATKADRAKETIAFAVNPDHRHDEAHEKAEDEERARIARGHRFESFADVREGNLVKWYISGHDYFYALSEILDAAKETIFICDWWLTPELFLRRPPAKHEDFRLDRLLLRKAQQGVKIFIVVYKEVTQTMTMSSAHTKHHLEDLHENIAVMRHPDHLGGEGMFSSPSTRENETDHSPHLQSRWSHHEKLVVVDQVVACIGGLDICFGRWDVGSYPLADVHPTDFSRTLFAGQDFNNARIQDFQTVDHWASNQQSPLEAPRMPWHDIHSMLTGPAVLDICQHFVERWNFIRDLKYRHNSRFPLLDFPHDEGDFEFRHPHLQKFREAGHKFGHVRRREPGEEGAWEHPIGGSGVKGTARVQVLRSSADWSHGIIKEHSIQNAYIQLIREARHFVFIENQFFIAGMGDKGPVENKIGAAIVERVLSAARNNEKLKVVIVIPAVPGFAGDLLGNSGTLAIMGAQYATTVRGEHSIFQKIKDAGYNPLDYIELYNLRSYDRINNDPDRLKRMAERSGITFEAAQAALSRVFMGPDALDSELEKNKVLKLYVPREGAELEALEKADDEKKKVSEDGGANPVTEVPIPQTYEEAWEIVRRFEQADDVREEISDSVAHHAMAGQGSLMDERWSGTEESERKAFVTEELYIHSKLMIVDDSRVIIGSANINDRSQLGDRDSEIACVYEDFDDTIDSYLAGKPCKVSRFAATLRRQLYKDHLGLSPPSFCPPKVDEEPVTREMKPVGVPHKEESTSADEMVMDPLSPETEALLRNTAAQNSVIFEDVFHCVPAHGIKNWNDYKAFVPPKPIKPGHVASTTRPVEDIKQQLSLVRGHIVAAPLDFLQDERLLALDANVNPITLS
ncbi:hypothetical protein JCM8547_002472 [Rhodosporidiobolus lusitaniae]